MKLEDIRKEVLSYIDRDELGKIVISGSDLPLKGFKGNAIAKVVRDTGYPTYIAVAWNEATKKPIIKYDPEACKGRIEKVLFVYCYEELKKVPDTKMIIDDDDEDYLPPVESMKVKEVVAELKSWGYTDEDISQLDGIFTKRQELKNARQLGGKL